MFVSRAHHDEIVRDLRQAYGHACGMLDAKNAELERARERYDALLEKYHALRVAGANVPEKLPNSPKSPMQSLGPKTIAALRDMSIGLHSTSRRAMEAVALSLHAEKWSDEQVAAKIYAGEGGARAHPMRRVPNGNGMQP